MRKRIFGRRLKRDTNERKALFRSLMIGLIMHGKIRTTEAKAKSIKGEVEKLVTIGKTKGDDAKRQLMKKLVNEKASDKLMSEVAPLFEKRQGGYTKIIAMGPRVKDGAKMVFMTWAGKVSISPIKEEKRNKVKSSPKKEIKVKEVKTKAKKSSK